MTPLLVCVLFCVGPYQITETCTDDVCSKSCVQASSDPESEGIDSPEFQTVQMCEVPK